MLPSHLRILDPDCTGTGFLHQLEGSLLTLRRRRIANAAHLRIGMPRSGREARGDTSSGRSFPPVRGFPWPGSITCPLILVSILDCVSNVLARTTFRKLKHAWNKFHGFLGDLENSDRNAHYTCAMEAAGQVRSAPRNGLMPWSRFSSACKSRALVSAFISIGKEFHPALSRFFVFSGNFFRPPPSNGQKDENGGH